MRDHLSFRHDAVQGLRRKVAEVRSSSSAPSPEQLDTLLTDCAAHALQLRAIHARAQRQLDHVLELTAELRALREDSAERAVAS